MGWSCTQKQSKTLDFLYKSELNDMSAQFIDGVFPKTDYGTKEHPDIILEHFDIKGFLLGKIKIRPDGTWEYLNA